MGTISWACELRYNFSAKNVEPTKPFVSTALFMVKDRYEEENENNERKDTGKDKQETHGQEEEPSP